MCNQRQNRLRRDFLKYDLKHIAQIIYAETIRKTKRVALKTRKESFLRTVQRQAQKLLRLFRKRQEYMFITR